jgi:hypothetical protein
VAAEVTRRQAGRLEWEEAEAGERSWGSGRTSGDALRTAMAATAGGVGPCGLRSAASVWTTG